MGGGRGAVVKAEVLLVGLDEGMVELKRVTVKAKVHNVVTKRSQRRWAFEEEEEQEIAPFCLWIEEGWWRSTSFVLAALLAFILGETETQIERDERLWEKIIFFSFLFCFISFYCALIYLGVWEESRKGLRGRATKTEGWKRWKRWPFGDDEWGRCEIGQPWFLKKLMHYIIF